MEISFLTTSSLESLTITPEFRINYQKHRAASLKKYIPRSVAANYAKCYNGKLKRYFCREKRCQTCKARRKGISSKMSIKMSTKNTLNRGKSIKL